MTKCCETCKFSRKATGLKCTMNLNNECGGNNFRFEYNFWTPWPDDGEDEEDFLSDKDFEI